jgi:hypothetical protein
MRFTTSPAPRALNRFLSSSQLARYAAKKPQIASKIPINAPKQSAVASVATYQSYASTLASKSHSTLLYTAPSHTWYKFSCYAAAFFSFSYAAYNFNAHYLHAPAELSAWVPIAFGGVCFMVACFGGWLLLGPARIVKTITAVPASMLAGKAGQTTVQGPLAIQVELRKMFPVPGFPARVITATPEELTLNYRLYISPATARQSAAEKLEARKRLEREQQEEREKSIWTAPFRHANKAFYGLFQGMRRTWTREGFLELGVKGQLYKLDITGGWALDEGKAIDRLAKLKI